MLKTEKILFGSPQRIESRPMRNSYKGRDSNQRQEELAIRADNELQWHTDKKAECLL